MRRKLTVLLAMISCAILLSINGCRFKAPKSPSDPAGILVSGIDPKQRGLLMQFVHSRAQVVNLLGNPAQKEDAAVAQWNRKIMRQQQYLDFAFIILYWTFFVFVLSASMRRSSNRAGRLLGWMVFICISVAALADFTEDAGILNALDLQGTSGFWPYNYGLTKWAFLFLALGISSLLFLRYPKFGDFSDLRKDWPIPRIATGIAFLAGSVLGIIGVIAIAAWGNGVWLTYGQLGLLGFATLFIFFLGGAGSWQA